jgi:hypothetical protein
MLPPPMLGSQCSHVALQQQCSCAAPDGTHMQALLLLPLPLLPLPLHTSSVAQCAAHLACPPPLLPHLPPLPSVP